MADKVFVLLYWGWYQVPRECIQGESCIIISGKEVIVASDWQPYRGHFKPQKQERPKALYKAKDKQALKPYYAGSYRFVCIGSPEKSPYPLPTPT